jgi:flagellar motor switch protein FliM
MKPQHDFTPARALAQHCAELFAPEPSEEERSAARAEELAVFTARLSRELQELLGPQLGGDVVKVACEEAGKRTSASLFKAIGPSAANIVMQCGTQKLPLLLSFDFGAAQALTEQAFGGQVRSIEAELAQLPRSAWLVLESVAAHIARGFGNAAELGAEAQLRRRHENVAKLDVFAKNASCLIWPVTVTLSEDVAVPFRIAVSEADFLEILSNTAGHNPSETHMPDPATQAAIFGPLPLPLTAVLADLKMPVARLARLKPGDFIPFSPRREVPLMADKKVIARGRIGALNDEVALNLTQIS